MYNIDGETLCKDVYLFY